MPKGEDLPPDAFGPPPGEKTYPCKNCGRKFVKDTLSKHENVCKKIEKKRKPFDAGKQRAGEGSDINYSTVKKVQKEIEKSNGKFKPPKTHWREKHEQFISNVRAARHVDYALKTGTPLPPPPKAVVPSDYVKCEHCGRNFNSSAAERHIPFCKEKMDRQNPRGNQPVKAKYPVPKPGKPNRGGGSAERGGGRTTIPQPVNGRGARGESPASRNTKDMKKLGIRKK